MQEQQDNFSNRNDEHLEIENQILDGVSKMSKKKRDAFYEALASLPSAKQKDGKQD